MFISTEYRTEFNERVSYKMAFCAAPPQKNEKKEKKKSWEKWKVLASYLLDNGLNFCFLVAAVPL